MKGLIPNPYNQILAQKRGLLSRAVRYALAPVCDPDSGEPILTSVQIRRQLKSIPFQVTTAGDNIIIPALAGVKMIYEVVLWNVAAQTVLWQQGLSSEGNPIPLLVLTSFPALTGFTLGFNGNFDMPHWEIDNGQPLVLNLAGGTEADGFIRYRVQNGTG